MKRNAVAHVLLALVVVVGMAVPAVAVAGTGTDSTASTAVAAAAENNSSVNVTVGQQLSTVVSVSSEEVQSDFEETEFELSYENASEEERAELIAERAEALGDRAEAIREEYESATEAFESGGITKSAYAQRIATLNARATNVLNSYEQLNQRAENVSAIDLRAAGLQAAAFSGVSANLSTVSGTGAKALLRTFTGESEGELEIESENGLSVEVSNEDGERSREIDRPRDGVRTITVDQSTAFDTARAALSTTETGSWVLVRSKVSHEDGSYEFRFTLRNASNLTGEAEVDVDGSSGDVYSLEEEIEAEDEDDEERDGDENEDDSDDERADDDHNEEGELALIVADGTPEPNATVTVKALENGEPAANLTVFLNEEAVGTTDADGTLSVTLPASGEVSLTADNGADDGELEFEFDEEDSDDIYRQLNVDAALDGDTVTVTVNYDGAPVANANVYANSEKVGTTGADGTLSFTTNASEELELEVVKGEFEAELTFAVQDGSLTLTESAHEGDGDKSEREEREREEEEEEEEEEESDESDEEEDAEDTEETEEAEETEEEEETEDAEEADEADETEETEETDEEEEAEDETETNEESDSDTETDTDQ